MTYSELEAFLTIVNHNSFSSAANTLFITQPALSRKIGYLERELGYKLFSRSKGNHNIYLTPEGNEFIYVAKELKRLMEISKSINTDLPKKLDIVMAYPFTATIWDKIIDNFISSLPDSRFSVTHSSSASAYQLVENGTIDIAITVNPQHSNLVETIPLIQQDIFVLSNKKISDSNSVNISDLDIKKEVFFPLSNDFISWHNSQFGLSILPKAIVDNRDMLDKYLNKETDDIWLFASYFLKEYVLSKYDFNVYSINDEFPNINVYAIKSKYSRNPAVNMFIDHIKNSFSEETGIKIY